MLPIVATLMTIAALWLLGDGNGRGFLVGALGCVVWVCAAFQESSGTMLWSLVATNVVIGAVNLRGYRKWSRG